MLTEGGSPQSIMLPNDTIYPGLTPLMLFSLLPATNYSLRSLAIYPNDEEIYSDPVFFVTIGAYLVFLYSYDVHDFASYAEGVPGTPEISLDGFVLKWMKPRENGMPINQYTLKRQSRY